MPAPMLAVMIRPVNPAKALARQYLRHMSTPRVPRRTRPGKYAVIKSAGLGFPPNWAGWCANRAASMFHRCGLDLA